jgi:ferredoxin
MCEFCLKHGEGETWYLQARNYSDDLLADIRRRKFIEDFFSRPERWKRQVDQLDMLAKAPSFVQRVIRWGVVRHMKRNHYGQVVPIEDLEKILDFANSVVRVACFCRHVNLGQEQRYCYGVSLGPNGGAMGEILRGLDQSFLGGPENKGIEQVTKEEALASFHKYEKQGLCHSVWTFQAPFIGGICNCDRSDCLAMHTSVTHGMPVMFRSEYIATNDPDKCKGCRQCMKVCQFGAIGYSAATKKSFIDPRRCYGCGICRSVCKKDAISLSPRADHKIANAYW